MGSMGRKVSGLAGQEMDRKGEVSEMRQVLKCELSPFTDFDVK